MRPESDLINNLKHPETRNKAFKELLDMYQERLYWHIRKIVITHDNANDVLQNTFIRVHRNIHKFKGNSALLTWMFRIAYNESLRFLEKNKRMATFGTANLKSSQIKNLTQDAYFDGEAVKLKLHRIVSELSDKQRLVFQMKYFDELSFREISDIINISENTLKSSYYSAVKIIEEKIIL